MVLADPPYVLADAEMARVLTLLTEHGWLAPGALVIMERATRSGPPVPARWVYARPVAPLRGGDLLVRPPILTPPVLAEEQKGWEARATRKLVRVFLTRHQRSPRYHRPGRRGIRRGRGGRPINVTKKSLFTVDERVGMLQQVTSQYANVTIDRFHGLLVDFCAANGISAVVKGWCGSDFEYEMQMAQMTYRMAKVETMFMVANPDASLS